MTKLSLEQILNIPQLSFYLEPQEFTFFIPKSKDYGILANVYNTEKVDAGPVLHPQVLHGMTWKA